MNKLMQERIEKFNQMVMNIDLERIPFGLYHGKMGLCIYFYELADLTSEKKYRVFAEKLLDDVIDNLLADIVIFPENGSTGICLAINYLLDKGYVKGNPNYVLKNLDDKIIQSLLFDKSFDNGKKTDLVMSNLLLGSLVYLAIRLQNTRLNHDEKQIMQNVIIENVNKIESLEIDIFAEPAFFSVTEYFMPRYLQLLQQIYQLNFYNYKIEKIIDELSPHILYRYPLNKANRLSLFSAMNQLVATCGNINRWDEYMKMLLQNLNVSQIINEFRNKNIVFFNGLCGFYYLLRKVGRDNGYNDLFLNKITSSDIWNQLPEDEKSFKEQAGLYGGLPGVILTYLHILNDSNSVLFFDNVIRQYV